MLLKHIVKKPIIQIIPKTEIGAIGAIGGMKSPAECATRAGLSIQHS